MRNPAVAHIYGHGKSRSKPLYRKSMRNIIIQHKGHVKLSKFYDAVIKKTAPVKIIKFSKLSLSVKKSIQSMRHHSKTISKKLNINKRFSNHGV